MVFKRKSSLKINKLHDVWEHTFQYCDAYTYNIEYTEQVIPKLNEIYKELKSIENIEEIIGEIDNMNNMLQENGNIIEKALLFATMAHMGQVRKNQPDKPYIIHPIGVAEILIQYGADNNVVAAGILHDVVENTNFTIKDIRENFGEDVAHLVEVASEKERDKKETEEERTKSWEERKQQKIDKTRNLTLREKLVPTADKIDNAENILRDFKEKGKKDFSAFRRGKEKQEWYNRNMYEALIEGQDKENLLFKRLEEVINNLFERTMEEYNNSLENEER